MTLIEKVNVTTGVGLAERQNQPYCALTNMIFTVGKENDVSVSIFSWKEVNGYSVAVILIHDQVKL